MILGKEKHPSQWLGGFVVKPYSRTKTGLPLRASQYMRALFINMAHFFLGVNPGLQLRQAAKPSRSHAPARGAFSASLLARSFGCLVAKPDVDYRPQQWLSAMLLLPTRITLSSLNPYRSSLSCCRVVTNHAGIARLPQLSASYFYAT